MWPPVVFWSVASTGRSPFRPRIFVRMVRGRSISTYHRIYQVVRRIPRGRVATYGQVARVAGLPGRARQVGYALAALPGETAVPWHRVVNARGEVSMRSVPGWEFTQRVLLEREGVTFDGAGRIKLADFGWLPRRPKTQGHDDV